MAFLHIESPRAPRHVPSSLPGEDCNLRDSKLILGFSRVRRLPSLSARLDEALRRQHTVDKGLV